MLIVTRCEGEDVLIDVPGVPTITVRLVEVAGGRVRVGVDAPADVSVMRRELWSRDRDSREKELRKGQARRARAADAARPPTGVP